MTKRKIVLISLVLMLFIPLLASVYVKGDINTLISYKTNSAPTIDGTFTESEWTDAYHTSFFHEPDPIYNHQNDYVHIYIKNTETKLFILFDDLCDNSSDLMDHVYIDYDCNYDNQRDINVSMRLGRGSNGLIGDIMANWSFGFGTSPNKIESHTIIEIAINITFSSSYDGSSRPDEMNYALPVGNANETIRIFFDAAEYISDWKIPENGDVNSPASYADLTLNRVPSNIAFGSPLLIGSIMIIALSAISLRISKRTKANY